MKCSICGDDHRLVELELTFKRPDVVASLSAEERSERCKESADLARLDHARWFVRGTIPFPVSGRKRKYRIGAWAEVDKNTLERILEHWEDEQQDSHPPLPARLANEVPGHRDSCGQRALLQLVGPETRPEILIPDTDTSLGAEQASGISEDQAVQYSSYIFHGNRG